MNTMFDGRDNLIASGFQLTVRTWRTYWKSDGSHRFNDKVMFFFVEGKNLPVLERGEEVTMFSHAGEFEAYVGEVSACSPVSIEGKVKTYKLRDRQP